MPEGPADVAAHNAKAPAALQGVQMGPLEGGPPGTSGVPAVTRSPRRWVGPGEGKEQEAGASAGLISHAAGEMGEKLQKGGRAVSGAARAGAEAAGAKSKKLAVKLLNKIGRGEKYMRKLVNRADGVASHPPGWAADSGGTNRMNLAQRLIKRTHIEQQAPGREMKAAPSAPLRRRRLPQTPEAAHSGARPWGPPGRWPRRGPAVPLILGVSSMGLRVWPVRYRKDLLEAVQDEAGPVGDKGLRCLA
eukprot:jgi/Botrbrau1/3866/Bobra.0183s0090.1